VPHQTAFLRQPVHVRTKPNALHDARNFDLAPDCHTPPN